MVLRDRTPDVREIVELAKVPTDWSRSGDTLLVSYALMPAGLPGEPAVQALQVLDRRGRVTGQWAEYWPLDYWAVPGGFVGMTTRSSGRGVHPMLVRGGVPSPLTEIKGARAARSGEVRFGQGWLLDEEAMTVTREKIEGCRPGSIRIDTRGRIWCLNRPKTEMAWSEDGQSWTRHQLSTSYTEFCDGGARGSDLEVVGDVVAIGLWRADVSLDRGATWGDVELPFRLVGAHRGAGGSFPNCTNVGPLPDGRLVMSYFGTAIADDATNTSWTMLSTPLGTTYAGRIEGALLAAPRRPFADGWLVSYDAGDTWRPLTIRRVIRHTLR